MSKHTILFFANLRETLGCSELNLDYIEGETIGKLIDRLIEQQGSEFKTLLDDSVKAAINSSLVEREQMIVTSSEIAFFPPVTGG